MRIFSDAAEYALRAVVWLAREPGQLKKLGAIAEATSAPPGYLIKVLQGLARAQILTAARGIRGGFSLRRDPGGLSVLEVVNAVDPLQRIRQCPLARLDHSAEMCPLHRRLDEAVAGVEAALGRSTIGELVHDCAPPEREACQGPGRAAG